MEARRYTGRVSGHVANSFGLHIELGIRDKMPHFDEFREILSDFDSKAPIFCSKVNENEDMGFEGILK